MAFLIFVTTVSAGALTLYRRRFGNSLVEDRAMRSLKASLRRDEEPSGRPVLALSRML